MSKKENYLNKKFIKINSSLLKNSKLKKIKELMYYVDKIICLTIKDPKYQKEDRKKVAIIFNLALGDGVIFNNALHDIRNIYNEKEYHITLFCQKGLEKIYNDNLIDEIIGLDFTKATIDLKERRKNIKTLKKNYYDILLDPVGANECLTNVLYSAVIKAKEKKGCIILNKSKNCSKNILKNAYNDIKELKEKSLIGQYFEFFYDDYEVKYYKENYKIDKITLPKKYYIVFPSASTMLKNWPIESYAEIIKKIYNKTKLPVLFCGTNSDVQSICQLKKLIGDIPQYDYVNKTSLLEFIEVIKKAKFVVTNDTSTYHIAVINEVPVTIITGGYTYDRYVEYNFKGCEKYKRPYIVVHKMDCFNCNNNCNKLKNDDKLWPCLEKITVDDAWKVIDKMIDKEL